MLLAVHALSAQYTIAPDTQSSSQDQIILSAVGGMNIATKSAVRDGDAVSAYTNFSFGIQGWYRRVFEFNLAGLKLGLQPGLFLGLTPIYRYTDSSTSKKSSDIKYPVIAEVRAMHESGMYAGIGGGWAYTVITNNDIKEASGSAAIISLVAGYERKIWQGIQIGASLRAQYYLQQLESANGTRTSNSNLNIMPAVTVGYGF